MTNTRNINKITTAVLVALTSGSAFAASENSRLEETVVTSSRVPIPLREVGTSVTVVTKEDIQIRGFSTVADVLRQEPSITVSNNGGVGKNTELGIRGERGYRTKLYIDGMDVTDTSTPQAGPSFSHLSSAGVERIEILRGPQGMMYGADAGGVISISTQRATLGSHGSVSAEYGRYGTAQFAGNIAGGNELVDFSMIASSFETDGFNTRTTDPAPKDKDGYENQTLHIRAGVNITDSLRAELVGRSVEGDNEFDSCSLPVTFDSTDDCTNDADQKSWRAALSYSGDTFNHALSYNKHSSDREFFSAGQSTFATEGEIEKVEYLSSWNPQEELSLVFGAELENQALDDGADDVDRDQKAVFLEYQGSYSDQLFVTAGARYDDNDDFGSETTYRLSAAYLIDVAAGEIKLKGSFGSGFRAPSLSEIAFNKGFNAFPPASNVVLSAETSEGFEVGAGYYGDAGWFVEAVYFDQRTEDEIFFDLADFSGYLQGNGESTSEGLELIAELPVGEIVTITANYLYNDTETPDGIQRLRAPENLGNLGLRITPMDGKLTLNANVRISSDRANERDASVDDYEVLDISASYQVNKTIEVFGRIDNVTDEDYEEIPTYNTSGAAGYAGVRFTF